MLQYLGMANSTHQPDNDDLCGSDRVIEYYKQRVDVEELKRNLAMTVEERLLQLQRKIDALEAEQKARCAAHPM